MAQSSAPNPTFTPPNITTADLEAFHNAHFSSTSLDHFSTHFLGPIPEDETQEEVEDDGLGYYPDGIKRTLTDEQIAMFRHSEIQALLRERRHAAEKATPVREDDQVAEAEEGELEDDQDMPITELKQPTPAVKLGHQKGGSGNMKRQKGEQRKGRGYKQPPKPDLRKRTWDKVDRGLQSLDYGEEEDSATALPAASQRRRISYEDV